MLDRYFADGVTFAVAPGTAFEYSSLGYGILGRVISNVAGRRPKVGLKVESRTIENRLPSSSSTADGSISSRPCRMPRSNARSTRS